MTNRCTCGSCPACFWQPRGTQALWPLRANGLEPVVLEQLRGFVVETLAVIAEQAEEAELLGLDDSAPLHASGLHARLPRLRAAWSFSWPDHAGDLMDALLERETGRGLPGTREDFSRDLALFFYQAQL